MLFGVILASAIFLMVLACLLSLFFVSEGLDFFTLLNDEYILHLLNFSIFQAFLSMILSVIFGVFLSLALYRRNFFAKKYLLTLFNITFVMPVLIAVFGIVAIYGNSGLINSFFSKNILNIYGLNGILLAHLFFNIPLCAKIFYESLSLIDTHQHQIATQLGLNAWQKFLYLELPVLKQVMPHVASLVFVLCFTSFAIVLALGGGAKYTTIEVAIYQAIKYDFDLQMAGFLSLLQVFICVILAFLTQKFSKNIKNKSFKDKNSAIFIDSKILKILDFFAIFFAIWFIIPPLISVVYEGINAKFFENILSSEFLHALKNSLLIGIFSSFLSVVFGIFIIFASRNYRLKNQAKKASLLEGFGSVILIVPSIVVSTGAFILLNKYVNVFEYAFYFVVFTNSLMALPFVIRSLSQAFFSIEQEYKNLCQSLGIFGLNRLRLVEFKALKKPISSAIGLSFILSFGDLSVISIFGSNDFKTLPFLLYAQLGSYQMQKASVSALILLLVSLFSYSLIQNIFTRKSDVGG